MSKGERTREHILERAAALFNRQGYAGASLSDVMEVTGLRKGGIYRHFESKEALAAEAFDFAIRRMAERFSDALRGVTGSVERLHAIVDAYARIPVDPPVPGGCPLLNAGVEHDDGNPLLRERARRAVEEMRALLRRTVEAGIARGEIRADVDPADVAAVLMSTLEGAIMLARLDDDPAPMTRAVEHLRWYLGARVRA